MPLFDVGWLMDQKKALLELLEDPEVQVKVEEACRRGHVLEAERMKEADE